MILLAKSENGLHAQTSTSWRPFSLVAYNLKRVKIRISGGLPGFASKILSSDRVHGVPKRVPNDEVVVARKNARDVRGVAIGQLGHGATLLSARDDSRWRSAMPRDTPFLVSASPVRIADTGDPVCSVQVTRPEYLVPRLAYVGDGERTVGSAATC